MVDVMRLLFDICVCICVCVFSVPSGHLVRGVYHGRDGKRQRHLPGNRPYPFSVLIISVPLIVLPSNPH